MLNVPPNLFNVLATMAMIRLDEEYSPQSPEPSIPSPISAPPMIVSTIEGCTQPPTTLHFILRMSQDGSIGIVVLVEPLTPMSQDKYRSHQARPPHRRLHDDKKGN